MIVIAIEDKSTDEDFHLAGAPEDDERAYRRETTPLTVAGGVGGGGGVPAGTGVADGGGGGLVVGTGVRVVVGIGVTGLLGGGTTFPAAFPMSFKGKPGKPVFLPAQAARRNSEGMTNCFRASLHIGQPFLDESGPRKEQSSPHALSSMMHGSHLSRVGSEVIGGIDFVRSERFDRHRYLALVRDVNAHMIHAGLLLDHGEKQRVNQYMSALGALGETLSVSAASESKAQAREMMYDTGPLSPAVLDAVKGLGPAYSAVESAREDLIAHFRTVLDAHLFT